MYGDALEGFNRKSHHFVQRLPNPGRGKNLPRIRVESDVIQALQRDILESLV